MLGVPREAPRSQAGWAGVSGAVQACIPHGPAGLCKDSGLLPAVRPWVVLSTRMRCSDLLSPVMAPVAGREQLCQTRARSDCCRPSQRWQGLDWGQRCCGGGGPLSFGPSFPECPPVVIPVGEGSGHTAVSRRSLLETAPRGAGAGLSLCLRRIKPARSLAVHLASREQSYRALTTGSPKQVKSEEE